jgi:hypothetical protein
MRKLDKIAQRSHIEDLHCRNPKYRIRHPGPETAETALTKLPSPQVPAGSPVDA